MPRRSTITKWCIICFVFGDGNNFQIICYVKQLLSSYIYYGTSVYLIKVWPFTPASHAHWMVHRSFRLRFDCSKVEIRGNSLALIQNGRKHSQQHYRFGRMHRWRSVCTVCALFTSWNWCLVCVFWLGDNRFPRHGSGADAGRWRRKVASWRWLVKWS